MTENLRNDEMVELLSADFFRRYEPNAAWVHAGAHLQLQKLRGYWPFSSIDDAGNIYDLSGQGRTLTDHNNVSAGIYNLFPYMDFTPGSTQYFSRADEAGLSITGQITFGGWFWLDSIAGGNMDFMSKWDAGTNNRSYILWFNDATNQATCSFSSAGTAVTSSHLPHTTTLAASTWYHIVGRLNPNVEQSIFLDGVEVSTAVGVPASIFDSNAEFQIGYSVGGSLLDGRAAQCFLSAAMLPDVIIWRLFEQTRANFGK